MGLINNGKIHLKFCQFPNIGKKVITFDQQNNLELFTSNKLKTGYRCVMTIFRN